MHFRCIVLECYSNSECTTDTYTHRKARHTQVGVRANSEYLQVLFRTMAALALRTEQLRGHMLAAFV